MATWWLLRWRRSRNCRFVPWSKPSGPEEDRRGPSGTSGYLSRKTTPWTLPADWLVEAGATQSRMFRGQPWTCCRWAQRWPESELLLLTKRVGMPHPETRREAHRQRRCDPGRPDVGLCQRRVQSLAVAGLVRVVRANRVPSALPARSRGDSKTRLFFGWSAWTTWTASDSARLHRVRLPGPCSFVLRPTLKAYSSGVASSHIAAPALANSWNASLHWRREGNVYSLPLEPWLRGLTSPTV